MIPKFRAFVIETEKLQEVWKMRFYETEELYINEYYGQDFILMQSTGLHDKNGVEIFEGDIVNVGCTFRNPMTGSGTLTLNKNFEVVFINGMFTRDGSSMGLSKDLKYLTVIGNVHQHPGLLEASDE